MSQFFNIRALAGSIILEIYGVISEYDMFEEFLRWQISEMGQEAPLVVRMSSPGGDPRIAMSLYRIIKDHKGPSECYIEYMCDSAATLIACACDKVIGNEFPFEYMVHDPQMYTEWIGVEDGEAAVDFLAKTRDDMVRIYTEETGMSEDAIRSMMKDTTFMNAQEALSFGFIDEIKQVEQTLDAKVDYKIAANAYKDVRPKEFELTGRGKSSESESTKTKPIQAMNEWMKKVAAKLGLGDSADESDVVLNVSELKAKADKAEAEKADLTASLEEKETCISELEAENAQLKEQIPSEEEEEEEANEEVEAQLEAAVKDFKITAASKPGWAQQFEGNPEGLKATLKLIPKDAVKAGASGVSRPKSRAAVSVNMSDQAAKDLGIN